MKITELNISEFGCLKNRKIVLDGNMNIIYGENESGKSTLLLFIKFMLYGLGRRSVSNSERERSISWSGHVAAGSMTFSHGGKNYRIERRYTDGARSGSEKLSVVCLDDGREISVSDGVGEYFLGVPKEVFESSACVGQMSSTEINGEKVSSSIQNILTSADESVDTAKILKKLDAIRVSYRHKNKNGGSLYEAEQQISAQRQKLDKAREATMSLEEQTQKLVSAQRELDIVKRDFEYQDKLLSEFNKINIIKRFDECKAKEAQRERIALGREKYRAQVFGTGYFPTRQHLAELDFGARSLGNANERFEAKKSQFDALCADGYDERACELAQKAEAQGGAAAILADVESKKKRSKNYLTLTAVFALISGALSVAGVAAALILSLPLAFASLATLILPIAWGIVGVGKKKTVEAQINAVASEYDTTPAALADKLDACAKALAQSRELSVKRAKAEAEFAEAESALESAKADMARLLGMTVSDSEPTVENARAEYDRIADALNKYELLLGEEQTLERIVSAEREALCHYNEDELRGEVSIDVSAVTPNAIAEAERARKFLLQKKNSLELKIGALNDFVVGLRANATDPLPLADELAELEKKYAADSGFYDALTLAMESIEKAGSVMSGSVMPAIASQASEIMSRISREKYTTLRATSSFGVSLDSEGFGIKSDFLSGGTKDCAYIALRISLFMKIFGGELPPLILDEALCQFDDIRAQRALEYLCELSNSDIQCIFFTSHHRESEICDSVGAEYNLISL